MVFDRAWRAALATTLLAATLLAAQVAAPSAAEAAEASDEVAPAVVTVIATPGAPLADPASRRPAPPLYVAVEVPAERLPRFSAPSDPSVADRSPDQYAPDRPFQFVVPATLRRKYAAAQRISVPLDLAGDDRGSAYDHALDCMTMAIAYEAGREPVAGMESVGQVILNRMRGARFPKSACGVVFQGAERRTGCQFTFACDGSLRRSLLGETLDRSRAAAVAVLTGAAADHVAGATHYHADYVLPRWAGDGTRVTKIGAHIFYRMPGDDSVSAAAGALIDDAELAVARATRLAAAGAGAVRGVFSPWGLAMGVSAR